MPINFETTEELACVSNFTAGNFGQLVYQSRVYVFFFKANWQYNFNYWTGATQKGCKGQWGWCSGSEILPLPDNLTWAFNQPDNRNGADDCLQMRLFQNKSGIALYDRNCSDKFVIACEVHLTIVSRIFVNQCTS